MAVEGLTLSAHARLTTLAWLWRALGLCLCIGIAGLAEIGGWMAPLIGAPLFAIAVGVLIANALPGLPRQRALGISDISKLCLKGGIILLGASLDLGEIVHTGLGSLPLAGGNDGLRPGLRPVVRQVARYRLADALPDRHRDDDLRRIGDRGPRAGDPSESRGDRVFDYRRFLLQHGRRVHLPDAGPPARVSATPVLAHGPGRRSTIRLRWWPPGSHSARPPARPRRSSN